MNEDEIIKFEEWAQSNGFALSIPFGDESYESPATQAAWLGWQGKCSQQPESKTKYFPHGLNALELQIYCTGFDRGEEYARQQPESEPIYQVWFSKGQWADVPKKVYNRAAGSDRARVVYLRPEPPVSGGE